MKHRTCWAVLAAFSVLVAPAVWAAAEAEDGGGGNNIFAGDLGNVFWTLLIFGLVIFVLGKFAWGPILANLQSREEFIHDSLEQAKRDRDAAATQLAEYKEQLADARAEATAIVEEGRRDAEVVRHRIEEEARAEAEKMLERAKREIDIAGATAVKQLYEVSGRLATELAGRIVGRELSTEDHERLIRDSIHELEQVQS